MPVAPATIVRTKRSWPGTSTPTAAGPRAASGSRSRARSRSRAPAPREAVGVDAGQRPDQRGLAVVDVAGGAERQRSRGVIAAAERAAAPHGDRRARSHRRRACADRAAPGRRGSRAISGGSPSRSASHQRDRVARRCEQRDGRALELEQRQRAAADLAPPSRARRSARRQSPSPRRCARAASVSSLTPRASPAPGSRAARAPDRGTARASPRAPRARACRSAARGRADGSRAAATASRAPDSSPACGPPSSLSPEQQTSAAPAATERSIGGLLGERRDARGVGQHAGADVVDHRGRRARTASSIGTSSTNPSDAEVRRVDAQDRADRRPPSRARARSRRPGAVGGPDLDQRARRTARSPRGSGSRRRSRPAGRARRRPPGPGPASAAAASSTAAAPLLTDDRGLGAGQLARAAARRARGGCRARRVSRSSSRFE